MFKMEIKCPLKYIKNKYNNKYIGLFLNLKGFVMYLLVISLYFFFLVSIQEQKKIKKTNYTK